MSKEELIQLLYDVVRDYENMRDTVNEYRWDDGYSPFDKDLSIENLQNYLIELEKE